MPQPVLRHRRPSVSLISSLPALVALSNLRSAPAASLLGSLWIAGTSGMRVDPTPWGWCPAGLPELGNRTGAGTERGGAKGGDERVGGSKGPKARTFCLHAYTHTHNH